VINCDSNGEEKAIVNNEWLGIKKKEEVRIVAIPNDNRELSCNSKNRSSARHCHCALHSLTTSQSDRKVAQVMDWVWISDRQKRQIEKP
jgi:hypothetical protein